MAFDLTQEHVARAVVEEVGASLAATLDAAATTTPAGATAGPGWLVTMPVDGSACGKVTVWFDRTGATDATRIALMMDEAPDVDAVADLVREMVGQAGGSLVLKPGFDQLTFAPATVAAAEATTPTRAFTIDLAGKAKCLIGVTVTLAPAAVKAAAPARAPEVNETLDAVLDVDLPLVVRFGRTVMPFKTLSGLGPGSMVDMGRSPDDPVELIVGDRVIAYGEVVIVSGSYGVRITELNNTPRHRSGYLEA